MRPKARQVEADPDIKLGGDFLQQIFQKAYRTGALFPVWFGVLALAVGGASLMNGRLVMKHGMRRLSTVAAAVSITLVSVATWTLLFAFGKLPPFWLSIAYLLVVFICIGLLFGNLNALAMEPLGHIAGVVSGRGSGRFALHVHLGPARSARGAGLRRNDVRPDCLLRGVRSRRLRRDAMGRGRWTRTTRGETLALMRDTPAVGGYRTIGYERADESDP